jgi:MoxR-like ATPase
MSDSDKEAALQAEIDAELNRLLHKEEEEPEEEDEYGEEDYEEEEEEEEEEPEPEPEPVRKPRSKRSSLVDAAAKKKAKHRQAAPAKILEDPVKSVAKLAAYKTRIVHEIGKVVIGQQDIIDQVLTAFFAGGHCLLMGVPGLAKTLLVNTLSQTMALDFHRIQFTPDLMPTDITGTDILQEDPDTRQREFVFREGPIFSNVLLADEINRTPPKTQAALLEAMQEKQVSNGRDIYQLPKPFLVLATQNPIEQEGTYTMPEAQLDRFIFLVKVGYASEAEELQIVLSTTRQQTETPEPVIDGKLILAFQELIRNVPVAEHVGSYAVRLMRATRPDNPDAPDFIKRCLEFGCGPRAGQSLILAAKAHAALNGRFSVSCDDIRLYALPVLRHRIILNFSAVSEGLDADQIVAQLLEAVPEDA